MLEHVLKIITVLLFLIRIVYWEITAVQTNRAIPKNKSGWKSIGAYIADIPMTVLICLQLLGFTILPMQQSLFSQGMGFVIMVLGIGLGFKSRMDIGKNWVHAGEYQIKHNQTLTTKGIYAYIRHPIYLSFTLSYIGAELVAQSWLFIAFFAFFISSYFQAKKEEKILVDHFGASYKNYMRKTKMLIPYVL